MSNQAIHREREREVTANRTDIIIKNMKEKTCTTIDVTIPADRNVVQKEVENNLQYKSLGIEIKRIWNLKCTIIPVISQMKHQLDATLCRFYFCRVTLHVSGASIQFRP